MNTNFQANINISPNNEDPIRTVLSFLENYRKEQINREEQNYLELRKNSIDSFTQLSNFLLVISNLLLPISLGFVQWDFQMTNNKIIIWFNLFSVFFLILSSIFGFIHILKTKEFFLNLIKITNIKREYFYKLKYDLFNKSITEDKIKEYIIDYDLAHTKHNELNKELSLDMKPHFLYFQALFLLISIMIGFFSLVYLLSL